MRLFTVSMFVVWALVASAILVANVQGAPTANKDNKGVRTLDVTSDKVVELSKFALDELQKLSDNYKDLSIKHVQSATKQPAAIEGQVYFLKTKLQLNDRVSDHEIMVLEKSAGKFEGMAIDTFPDVATPSKTG